MSSAKYYKPQIKVSINKIYQQLMRSIQSKLLPSLILIIVSFAVSYQSLFNGYFCWDDKSVALAEPFRQLTFNSIRQLLFSFHMGLYHPLTSFSFMIDFQTGHGEAFYFHLTNLIIHSLNTLLLFFLLVRLKINKPISFFVALLFAVHPVHVEAVAWITSRKELLFTFFSLASLLYYLQTLEKGRKNFTFHIVLFFLVMAALLSKVSAVTLPLIFLLIDKYQKGRISLKLILEKTPLLLLCIFFGYLNILAQSDSDILTYGKNYSAIQNLVLGLYSVSRYFFQLIFPVRLSVFYPFPFDPADAIPIKLFIPPLIFLFLVASLTRVKWEEKRGILLGIIFFLVNIIVVVIAGFNRDYIIADRYNYFPSIGIIILISFAARGFATNFRKAYLFLAGIFIFVFGLFSYQTYERIITWRHPELLFTEALNVYHNSDIIMNTLASQKIDAGRFQEAIELLDKALILSPDYVDAYYNRGIANSKMNAMQASISDLSSAVRINPLYTEAYFARGNAFMKLNNLRSALDDFTMVIRLNQNHFGAWQNRAIIKGNLNDFQGALQDIDRAISLNPNFAASYYLKGIALFETGKDGCDDLAKSYSLGYMAAKKALTFYCGQ